MEPGGNGYFSRGPHNYSENIVEKNTFRWVARSWVCSCDGYNLRPSLSETRLSSDQGLIIQPRQAVPSLDHAW